MAHVSDHLMQPTPSPNILETIDHLTTLRWRLLPSRDENNMYSSDFDNTSLPKSVPIDQIEDPPTPYDYSHIIKVLIPVSIVGWILFGIICILCINGKGRAGYWVPEWYLDSAGARRDKMGVVLWWAGVILLWPGILPALAISKTTAKIGKKLAERRERAKGKTEARDENWV